jgi:hypothetical protein
VVVVSVAERSDPSVVYVTRRGRVSQTPVASDPLADSLSVNDAAVVPACSPTATPAPAATVASSSRRPRQCVVIVCGSSRRDGGGG